MEALDADLECTGFYPKPFWRKTQTLDLRRARASHLGCFDYRDKNNHSTSLTPGLLQTYWFGVRDLYFFLRLIHTAYPRASALQIMEKPFNCSECYLALVTCYIYSGGLSCIDYACRTWTPPICGYFEKGKTICFVLTVVCETPLMLCIATKVLLLSCHILKKIWQS